MAEPFVKLALTGASPLIQNYDTIYSKTKERIKRAGGKRNSRDQDYYEEDTYDSYNAPRRSQTERIGRNGGGGYYEVERDREYRNGRGYSNDREVEEVKREFPPNNGAVYATKTKRAQSVGTRGGGFDDDDYYLSDGRPSRRDYRPRCESCYLCHVAFSSIEADMFIQIIQTHASTPLHHTIPNLPCRPFARDDSLRPSTSTNPAMPNPPK